jgi:hypothetical protein
MQQAQREAATRSVQSWIDQVKKFDTVEDRVMVLSAAASTSPYESVQVWAREQLLRLDGELKDRKRVAEQKVALVERTTVPVTAPAATGSGSAVLMPPSELLAVARKDLARVTTAEQIILSAKAREPLRSADP